MPTMPGTPMESLSSVVNSKPQVSMPWESYQLQLSLAYTVWRESVRNSKASTSRPTKVACFLST